jgi:anti-sigma factor RsiW
MLLPEADPRLLVHAYVDGELDPANAGAIEWLIANDAALAAERDRVEALQRALRNNFASSVLSERAGCPPAQLGWRSPLRSR